MGDYGTNELEHTTDISRFKPRLIMPLYNTIIKSKVAYMSGIECQFTYRRI
jgi:hypothetical protein